jgi:hypothetical protein
MPSPASAALVNKMMGLRPNLAFQLMHILTPLSRNVAVHGQHLLVSLQIPVFAPLARKSGAE